VDGGALTPPSGPVAGVAGYAGGGGFPPMRMPQTSQKSSLAESWPLRHTAIAASSPFSATRYACSFLTRTVLVDLVSKAISSTSSTFFFSLTVPVSTSTTSTTLASSLAVSSLPDR
jgi:hypothetical protein